MIFLYHSDIDWLAYNLQKFLLLWLSTLLTSFWDSLPLNKVIWIFIIFNGLTFLKISWWKISPFRSWLRYFYTHFRIRTILHFDCWRWSLSILSFVSSRMQISFGRLVKMRSLKILVWWWLSFLLDFTFLLLRNINVKCINLIEGLSFVRG